MSHMSVVLPRKGDMSLNSPKDLDNVRFTQLFVWRFPQVFFSVLLRTLFFSGCSLVPQKFPRSKQLLPSIFWPCSLVPKNPIVTPESWEQKVSCGSRALRTNSVMKRTQVPVSLQWSWARYRSNQNIVLCIFTITWSVVWWFT